MTAVGAAGAFAVAVLRMRADMHWATDVTMGAIVGTAIGAGIPLVFHRRAAELAGPRANYAPSNSFELQRIGAKKAA
jgi:membrane-associated phospholipid phosphatase